MRWSLGRCTLNTVMRLKLSSYPSRSFAPLPFFSFSFVSFPSFSACPVYSLEYKINNDITQCASKMNSEPEAVFGELAIPADVLEELRSNIARRLTPQPVKIRADLELTNFAFSGILAIQAALAAGEALSTPEIPIKIRLVAPPLYVMVSNTTDRVGAIELLEKACEVIGERIREEEGGSLNVRMKPKAVSESDDAELQALMDRCVPLLLNSLLLNRFASFRFCFVSSLH